MRPLLVCSLVFALFLAACAKKAGDPCKDTGSSCGRSKKSALVCRGGTYQEVACAGPLACANYQDHANCDTSLASRGDLCMGEADEYACSLDKKRALLCTGGTYEMYCRRSALSA